MQNVHDTLAARELTHGPYQATALHAQNFKNLMRGAPNWAALTPVQAQSLDCVADKIARILCGDAAHPDHWQDGAGYFTLALRASA